MSGLSKLWSTTRGFFSHGSVSAGLSSLATAMGAAILGNNAEVVANTVKVAAVSNVVAVGSTGGLLGFFERDHHLFKKPEKVTDLVFWGKILTLVGAKTLSAYLGSLIIHSGESPNTLSASDVAISNLLGSLVFTAGSLGIVGLFHCYNSAHTESSETNNQDLLTKLSQV